MSLIDIEPALAGPVKPRTPPLSRTQKVSAAIIAVWLISCVYLVAPEQQAVVTRFGAIVNPRVMPGIHLSFPWPIDQVSKLKVQQLQRLVVGGDIPDSVLGRTQPLQSQWITGDQNIINMRVVVQYSVSVPSDYLFQSQDVARAVGAAVESEMARRIATRNVDAVLTTEKAAIQEEVRAASQKRINDYRSGVLLSTINIESVTPPPEAADSFRDVASARADAVAHRESGGRLRQRCDPQSARRSPAADRGIGSLQGEEHQRSGRRRGTLHAARTRVRQGRPGHRRPAVHRSDGADFAQDQEDDRG